MVALVGIEQNPAPAAKNFVSSRATPWSLQHEVVVPYEATERHDLPPVILLTDQFASRVEVRRSACDRRQVSW